MWLTSLEFIFTFWKLHIFTRRKHSSLHLWMFVRKYIHSHPNALWQPTNQHNYLKWLITNLLNFITFLCFDFLASYFSSWIYRFPIHSFMWCSFTSTYRLLNPKIVRACVVVLTDWEKIPTKSLKAAVTILHRIAYGCSCPAMLYQVSLWVDAFTFDFFSFDMRIKKQIRKKSILNCIGKQRMAKQRFRGPDNPIVW